MIRMRSKNTRKYADYYILLEKCVKYYNEYQLFKLQNKINEINTLKLLTLEDSDTLDNYVIVRDERKKSFKYGTIRGSHKNLRETMHDLDLTDKNIIFRVLCPHAMNLNKKIKELLNDNYTRQKVHILKDEEGNILRKWFEEEGNELAFIDEEEYVVTCNRWFKIDGMTEIEFIEKVREIHEQRFE